MWRGSIPLRSRGLVFKIFMASYLLSGIQRFSTVRYSANRSVGTSGMRAAPNSALISFTLAVTAALLACAASSASPVTVLTGTMYWPMYARIVSTVTGGSVGCVPVFLVPCCLRLSGCWGGSVARLRGCRGAWDPRRGAFRGVGVPSLGFLY